MGGPRSMLIAGSAALVLALAGCSAEAGPDPRVQDLHPDRPGGQRWDAAWDEPRRFTADDPADPWFVTDGSGSYEAVDGRLVVSGAAPRMYVRDPALRSQWRDVEITTFFVRRADAGVPYAGMTAVARTNHGVTGSVEEDLCDSRGYGARMRYDGRTDFEKETSHPANDAAAGKVLWPGGMPVDVWFGYKFLVYDLPDGAVKLELYLNEPESQSGSGSGAQRGGTAGGWRLVNELVDNGDVFGDEACAEGVDPRMPLTAAPDRPGSESGRPNLSVYFRSDGVGQGGLEYRNVSVREITAPTGG